MDGPHLTDAELAQLVALLEGAGRAEVYTEDEGRFTGLPRGRRARRDVQALARRMC